LRWDFQMHAHFVFNVANVLLTILLFFLFLFITHKLTKQGHMDGTQGGWCLETGAAFTQAFLVQPASSTYSAFTTLLRVLQGNLLELLATASTTLSSDPWARHPTSNTLYALCTPQHEPPKPTIHNLPYISHTPGQQRHDCRHLDSQARSA
jgi:hypothetical protein